MRRTKFFLVLLIAVFVVTSCEKEETVSVQLQDTEGTFSEESIIEETIFVHVCGAINREGVYELPVGSRVYEAIEMAEGFRNDAASEAVNQAEILIDGMRLYIPTKEEVKNQEQSSGGRININRATKEQLMSLPGVGETRAEVILRYRDEHGPFRKIEDIMNVTGIKEGLFSKIKSFITI